MWLYAQIIVSGFYLGSFYALIALGFSLIFGVTHAFNLAHGELIILSGYLAYVLWKYGQVSPYLSIPVCLAVMPGVALLLHLLLQRLKAPFELNSLVVTFGLALFLQNAMLFAFSADYRLIHLGGSRIFQVPGTPISLTAGQLWVLSLSLAATGGVHWLLYGTFLGKALRAAIQDRQAALLAGINVTAMRRTAFLFGGMLIGLAGPLYALSMYLHPAAGLEPTLIAIVITIFAGVGRTRGILAGGWLLGVAESLAAFVLGTGWRELVSAVVLLSLLILKPQGILLKG
ncbi:MAG: branched-chain amino acid ABC transporter permease [Deltaproteobacteria bacterium]|nr:branched-chain amino acid ABC transporter permease [Deltaproteobacteria bacterium]